MNTSSLHHTLNKHETLPPAIFLMGPTASGKTALSVQLAHHFNAEIISVDSALVFKGMDIGTAKPTLAEREGIPHYLIDIIDPIEVYSTGQFRTHALSLMAEITARGKIPLLVGGTMLYFNALTHGLAQLPEANPEMREKLEQELVLYGKEEQYKRLVNVDPQSAARIHPNDPQRIQRALEVYEITGYPLSHFFKEQGEALPYSVIKLVIAPENRGLLHEKIAARFQKMLTQGFMAEVESLYQRGDLTAMLPAIRAVGYRQAWSYLEGEYTMETMTEKAIIATRQLAKRQFTWLRRETDAYSFIAEDEKLWAKVTEVLKCQLAQ
jgi:tRNA dimethylallyltransferase